MFSLGKDVKNNSLDSKEPEGREERTPQEWRMKQQKYSAHAWRTGHFLCDGWKQSHIWVLPAKFLNNSKKFHLAWIIFGTVAALFQLKFHMSYILIMHVLYLLNSKQNVLIQISWACGKKNHGALLWNCSISPCKDNMASVIFHLAATQRGGQRKALQSNPIMHPRGDSFFIRVNAGWQSDLPVPNHGTRY